MKKYKKTTLFAVATLLLFLSAGQVLSFCLIRGGLGGGPNGREDCCTQDPSQWRWENIPVQMWINEDTDPELWDGIRVAYDVWEDVPSAYLAVEDAGFTPIYYVNVNDGVNVVSFSNDTGIFPPGSNTIAFTSGNWGVNVGSDETITGFDVIFNDVGFDFGYPPGPGEFSVVGITGHEIGHAWGLAHCWEGGPPGCGPNCVSSTMYGYSSAPNTEAESLELDDIAAITLAYPNWLLRGNVTDAVTTDPIPYPVIAPSITVAMDTMTYGVLPSPLPGDHSGCGYDGVSLEGKSDGTFEFAALESDFDVVVFKSGYLPDTVTIGFTGIDTTTVDVALDAAPFSSITGTLTDGDTHVGILGGVVLYQNGEPYDTAYTVGGTGEFSFPNVPVSLPPFIEYTGYEMLAVLPYPASTIVDSVIEVNEGAPTELDLTLLPAEVLLVDDDGGAEYEDYFTPAIDSTGRTYVRFDVFEREASAMDYLDRFPSPPTIVWFTGNEAESTITKDELDSLNAHIDRGGNVLLTGQNIVEDLWSQDSVLVRDNLHVSYLGNVSFAFGRGEPLVPLGRQFEKILLAGNNGANNQTSKETLAPLGDAFNFLYYTSSPIDTTHKGNAGIAEKDLGTSGNSRRIILPFGFEALNRSNYSDTSMVTRSQAMGIMLDWIEDVPTGLTEDEPGGGFLPKVFSLGQNYPNPFNPQTTIQFTIPSDDGKSDTKTSVNLKVYNLRGQFVVELINDDLVPGHYSVHWDGKDRRGNGVPSGMYLYKLTSGKESSTRKMVVLK